MAEQHRLLRPNPFAGDTGEIEPELAKAFAQPLANRATAVVAALTTGRVVLPISPHAQPADIAALTAGKLPVADEATTESGCASELELNSSIPEVAYPGGATALPVFSSAAQLASWGGEYRPLLLKTRAAAALALQRYDGQMVLDPQSSQQTWLGRSVTVAWITEMPWIAPWADPELASYLANIAEIDQAVAVEVHAGLQGAAVIQLGVPPASAARQMLLAAVQKITTALGEDTYLKARFDVVEIRPETLESSVD
ncbi:MAG: SseB family protein [Trueperella sp.]|nr:SseB family protein [Trueperella sp.]